MFAIGRTAPGVMSQIGHTDPRLTLRVYAGIMSQDQGERDRLQALVDAKRLGTKRHWRPKSARAPRTSEARPNPERPDFQHSFEWAVLGSNQRPPACKAGALTS